MFCDASTFASPRRQYHRAFHAHVQPRFCNSLLTGRVAVDNLCVPEGYMTAPRTTAHAVPENAACTCTLAEVSISLLWQIWQIWHTRTPDIYLCLYSIPIGRQLQKGETEQIHTFRRAAVVLDMH